MSANCQEQAWIGTSAYTIYMECVFGELYIEWKINNPTTFQFKNHLSNGILVYNTNDMY